MAKILWDQPGTKRIEQGVDHGVLYKQDMDTGEYDAGSFPWMGLTTVTESPSGAESNKQFADNIEYANLQSAEQFGCTIEAFTYPDAFEECDGTALVNGVAIGQQGRKPFGFSWRSLISDDLDPERGEKIHVAYGLKASPSEKARTTVNDSPEGMGLSWECAASPVGVPGTNPATGKDFKPTAHMVFDSTLVDPDALADLKDILYGTDAAEPRLPLPGEILALFAGTVVEVETAPPTYDAGTDIITIPAVVGVEYLVDDEVVPSGAFGPIADDTVVHARATAGHVLSDTSDNSWTIYHA